MITWSAPAERELATAYAWYERRRPGLGQDLVLCTEAALDAIARHPRGGAPVHEDVRRVLIRRFPYGIYYRDAAASLEVIGFRHFRQGPQSR